MKQIKTFTILAFLITIFLLFPNTSVVSLQDSAIKYNSQLTNAGAIYSGQLRIYVLEIKSRWIMHNEQPYEYAFYDYAYNGGIEIQYLQTYENTVHWQGDVEEDNILIIASVFNSESQRKYSDPPGGRPFDAYYVDACAATIPGETGANVKNEEYSHTVFCEVGTATTCQYCPILAENLNQIFEENKYPFYFVEMVTDMSSAANNRMVEYNQKLYPTAYYDGGLEIVIGSGYNTTYLENVILQAGKRDVHDLDLTIGSTWLGEGSIDITVHITNNEELPNTPPVQPTINGPSSGRIGERCEFQVTTTDPDFDDVYYMFDWGDDTYSNWLGSFTSGETISYDHIWTKQGNYIVKVKAKDVDGFETDWAWLQISMPKNVQIRLSILHWLLSKYPYLDDSIGDFVKLKVGLSLI